MVQEINALQVKGLDFAEDTKVENSVLEGIVELAQAKADAEELVEGLNAEITELNAQVALLKKSGGRFVSPVVEFQKKKYVFQDPKFRLPKAEPTTADAVIERNDSAEIAECIKRGVLVEKEG